MIGDLKANYQGVYENRIGFGKRPAMLLVDFVQAYFEPSCDLYAGVEDALASAIRVRDAVRVAGMPVVYTNVVYQKQALNGGRFSLSVTLLLTSSSTPASGVSVPPGVPPIGTMRY